MKSPGLILHLWIDIIRKWSINVPR